MNRKKTCGCFSFGKKRKPQIRRAPSRANPALPQRKESLQPQPQQIEQINKMIELNHQGEQGGLICLKTKVPLSQIEKIDDMPDTEEQRNKFKYMCPLCLCYFSNLKENPNIVPRCPTCCNQDFQIRDVNPESEVRIYSDEQRLSLRNSMRETVISKEEAQFLKTKTGRIDPSIVLKLQVLSDQHFFKTHHAMFRDANNKSPFGQHLRKSIMNFSCQRQHFQRLEREHESPEQLRKRYTHTLSQGFKDYFSSYPEERKEEEELDLLDQPAEEISENLNHSFDADMNEREDPHQEEKELPHLRSNNQGQWPKVRESQVIVEEQSLEDADSRFTRPSEKFQSLAKQKKNEAIEEEKEVIGFSPSSNKDLEKNEEYSNYMQYQQSHSNHFMNLHSGLRVVSADPVLKDVKLPNLLDDN